MNRIPAMQTQQADAYTPTMCARAHTHNSKAEEPHILSDDRLLRAGKGVPLEASQTPFPAKMQRLAKATASGQ